MKKSSRCHVLALQLIRTPHTFRSKISAEPVASSPITMKATWKAANSCSDSNRVTSEVSRRADMSSGTEKQNAATITRTNIATHINVSFVLGILGYVAERSLTAAVASLSFSD